MRRTAVTAVGVLCCALTAGCSSATSSRPPSSRGPRVAEATLRTKVAPKPEGFVSERRDSLSGELTGYLAAHRLLPLACDATAVTRSEVLGGEMRFYDGNPSYPGSSVVLCLADLAPSGLAAATAAAVVHERETSGAPTTFPFRTFVVPAVPGATGIGLNGNESVYFGAGPYFVSIEAIDYTAPNSSVAQVLAREVAQAEYRRLRG
jgi:hypothetical protein